VKVIEATYNKPVWSCVRVSTTTSPTSFYLARSPGVAILPSISRLAWATSGATPRRTWLSTLHLDILPSPFSTTTSVFKKLANNTNLGLGLGRGHD